VLHYKVILEADKGGSGNGTSLSMIALQGEPGGELVYWIL